MNFSNRLAVHAYAWRVISVVLCAFGGVPGLVHVASAQTPNYQGQACRVAPDRVRLELETDDSVTAVLVYPTPPGGGWWLDREAVGRFSREFQVPVGGPFAFTILMQNPQQYVYPEHRLEVDDGCVTFVRDDVMSPPPRGFRHELTEEESGVRVDFEASDGDLIIPGTVSVDLRYRLNGGDLVRLAMEPFGERSFSALVPEASKGDRIEYWFAQRVGSQPVDSVLHDRVVGRAADVPVYPLVARAAGRFRDRHPNEWRFDHFVENYAGGKTFEIVIVDHGHTLELEVVTEVSGGPERVDFKYYIQSNPQEMCDRPLTAINLVMDPVPGREGTFRQRIPDITPGQIIEFDFTHIGVPNPAGGTFQYYTEYFYYHAGKGRFGIGEANPRAIAGGDASVPLVTAPRFAFAQHANNLSKAELDRFMEGKVRFETDHVDGLIKNLPTTFDCCSGPIGYLLDQSPHARQDALGPSFAAASCIDCHSMDGRGATPTGNESTLSSLVVQLAVEGVGSDGGPRPHPYYGRQFDTRAREGGRPEGRVTVSYEEVPGVFDDGTPYSLRRPIYAFHDTSHGSPGANLPDSAGTSGYPGLVRHSPRIAPILAGTGLLEAVEDAVILGLADPDDTDGDGISGRVNWVRDSVTGEPAVGRFGWKAGQPSLLQQTAIAYQRDLGLTSPFATEHDCGVESDDCPEGDAPELAAEDVFLVASYVEALAVPARRNHEDPEAIFGLEMFKRANCQGCHVPTLRTRANHHLAGYRDQVIEPFTDLLLHDMGPGLADGFEEYGAGGSEWRTAPLWGAEFVGHALGRPETCADPYSAVLAPNYLHDGRARSLMEAILWHGGEAETSRRAVLAMNRSERDALLRYLAYPFADPSFESSASSPCHADLDGDGLVGGADLSELLVHWGMNGKGDLDGNGRVDGADLSLLLLAWGACA